VNVFLITTHQYRSMQTPMNTITFDMLFQSLKGKLSCDLFIRLEVQAEVTPNSTQQQKRASLSSESVNFSIDAKSITVSFGDNVSIIALAGSICAR